MELHHTKNKGDFGVLKVCLDLHNKGYDILLPFSEHLPYDIVANKNDVFLKIQVKYRKVKNGAISVGFRKNRIKTDKWNGIDRDKIDYWAIYCPETDDVYYIKPKEFQQKTVHLRIQDAKNNQRKLILYAEDFLNI